jgi:hypothetical protein
MFRFENKEYRVRYTAILAFRCCLVCSIIFESRGRCDLETSSLNLEVKTRYPGIRVSFKKSLTLRGGKGNSASRTSHHSNELDSIPAMIPTVVDFRPEKQKDREYDEEDIEEDEFIEDDELGCNPYGSDATSMHRSIISNEKISVDRNSKLSTIHTCCAIHSSSICLFLSISRMIRTGCNRISAQYMTKRFRSSNV